MRKLNMWQRLGIIASALWMVGGGLWQRTSDVDFASSRMFAQYLPCSETASQLASGADEANAKCMSDALKTGQIFLEGSWGNVAVFAIGPMLLTWISIYVILWLVRWVKAGRKHSISPTTDL